MADEIKLRMTAQDLTDAAALLDKRGKEIKIPRPLLSKLVCDYGTLFEVLDSKMVTVKEKT